MKMPKRASPYHFGVWYCLSESQSRLEWTERISGSDFFQPFPALRVVLTQCGAPLRVARFRRDAIHRGSSRINSPVSSRCFPSVSFTSTMSLLLIGTVTELPIRSSVYDTISFGHVARKCRQVLDLLR